MSCVYLILKRYGQLEERAMEVVDAYTKATDVYETFFQNVY